MARVTVEDCLKKLDNRFDLVLVSSKRARQLATGGKDPYLDWENDKPTVVALREIAEGYVDRSILIKKPNQTQGQRQDQPVIRSMENFGKPSDTSEQALEISEEFAAGFSAQHQPVSTVDSSSGAETPTSSPTISPSESAPSGQDLTASADLNAGLMAQLAQELAKSDVDRSSAMDSPAPAQESTEETAPAPKDSLDTTSSEASANTDSEQPDTPSA